MIKNELVSETNDQETIFAMESAYSRQISYFQTFTSAVAASSLQKKILESNALVIGLGGIGSHICDHLVRIGVTKFVLIDFDKVERSNLNRQILYDSSDISNMKTESAAKRLSSINEDVTCTLYQSLKSFLADKHVVKNTNVAFVSADMNQLDTKRNLIPELYKNRIPYVFAGYNGSVLRLDPRVLFFDQGCGSCAAQLSNFEGILHELRPQFSVPASGYAINAFCASLAVESWYRALESVDGEDTSYRFDMSSNCGSEYPLRRVRSCPICDDQAAEKLQDP